MSAKCGNRANRTGRLTFYMDMGSIFELHITGDFIAAGRPTVACNDTHSYTDDP